MLNPENWRAVEGFPNTEVSDQGRVRSLFRGVHKIRSLHLHEHGYLTVSLQNKKLRKRVRVHRLVAAAFLGPIPKKKDVNHRDGVKTNNEVNNLEYVTRSENHRHAFRLGLSRSPFTNRIGSKHYAAKLRDSDVLSMRNEFAQGISRKNLASKYGVSYYTVWDITARRSWTHL